MIPHVVILPLLVTQVLSAPTGCVESCSSYVKQYQTQGSSNYHDHSDLTQAATRLQGLDYSRPGTWNEHNDYNVDNGHGKVYEERGQVVEGPKTVRYYKKNYTSSYSTRHSNGAGLSELEHQNNEYGHNVPVPTTAETLDSQRAYNQVGASESIAQQHRYNRIQNQHHAQSAIRRTNAQSERLEDFGEYNGNSQTVQGASNFNTQISQEPYPTATNTGNWSNVDSYRTDGGRGRVFEEEGQYVSGAKKVRYYKRNYTSGYSSTGALPIPDATAIGVDDLHQEMEKMHREIGKEMNRVSNIGNIASSNIAQTNTNTYGLISDNHHRINSNSHRNRFDHENSYHRNEDQQLTDTTSGYVPHINPSQSTYGTNSFSKYERHESRVTNHQPIGQFINPTSGYTNVLSTGNSGYSSNAHDERLTQQQVHNLDQTDVMDRYQSQHVQDQMTGANSRRNVYNQNGGVYSGTPRRVTHYNEHWSSSQTKETAVPQYSRDISQISGQSAKYNTHQYGNQHNAQQTVQENGYMQQYGRNFNSGHQTRLDTQMNRGQHLGQGHDTVDCEFGTEEHSHSSQYQTRYKRSIKPDKLSDMEQHSNSDDFTQQTTGDLEVGQQSQHSFDPWSQSNKNLYSKPLTHQAGRFEDYTQQTSGKPEFGSPSQHSHQPRRPGYHDQYSEDLTQQTGEFDDLTQQTGEFDDLTQQTSGKLELGSLSQNSYQPQWLGAGNQYSDDLTQQTNDFEGLTQQTSGKLELGSQTQHTHQPQKPGSRDQHPDDLTQQTGEFDDLTQQTSGKLNFGSSSQHSNQPQRPGSRDQHSDDLTQQTDEFDDLTQQTSGKLEFGSSSQHSNQPRKPGSRHQHSEDLTQQTDEFDDLTQQTSGKLEFGLSSQHSNQLRKPGSRHQHSEDLTQQTGEFDDLTQQTSGKLEFGSSSQHPYQPRKPGSRHQHSDDLTQQTGEFDDLTQQTSGKLEFGPSSQQSNQPGRPGSRDQHSEDLTQQTGEFDDLTQQTSGKLDFGPSSQHPYQPRKPGSRHQHSEDLTQQTGEFDDLTQQTSGKLEFGSSSQHSNQPRRPGSRDQHSDDLTQQTDEFDDLTQQTSGKLEFGPSSQQSNQPGRPGPRDQHSEDLTQQTGEFDDLTQQTSGKLDFGPSSQHPYQPRKPGSRHQHSEDLTQQTGEFDDLTQQTSGKLEFGPSSQHPYEPRQPGSRHQHSEDLTQQTSEFDDLTQQTSGKLEFGSSSQHSNQPRRPGSRDQHSDDLTQQTDEFDDLTQQTSGKLEFGPSSQQSNQPGRPGPRDQHSEDLTQQTGEFDDLTQQTSGKLEFGPSSQQSNQPGRPGSRHQHSEDLTQQTGGFDDLTQQTSGKLDFGPSSQHPYQPRKPGSRHQHSDDLTQQTGEFDDLTQQTSGKLEFGPQYSDDLTQQTDEFGDFTQQTSGKLEPGQLTQSTYHPWKPDTSKQHSEDLTQQTGNFDDLTQQTTGKLEFDQQSQNSYHPWKPSNQHSEDLTPQVGKFDDLTHQTSDKISTEQSGNLHKEDSSAQPNGSSTQIPKPAKKPKPRSRYLRRGSVINIPAQNQVTPSTINQQNELPPKVLPEVGVGGPRSENIRGDQDSGSSTDKSNPKDFNQNFGDLAFGNDDQDRLQKSNDATVGVQWHYTYHPSDQRHFVQQPGQKEKDDSQQQLSHTGFTLDSQHALEDLHLQSSNQRNGESGLSQQSQKNEYDQETELGQKLLDNIEKGGQFQLSQQTVGHTKNRQNIVPNSGTENKLEPRIIEAYGGGPYDAFHSDDIYNGVRVNPSATLPPIVDEDPWYIREKPRELNGIPEEATPPPMSVRPLGNEPEATTPSPSFWSRIGNKLTNSFDKAKEKARNIFG